LGGKLHPGCGNGFQRDWFTPHCYETAAVKLNLLPIRKAHYQSCHGIRNPGKARIKTDIDLVL
jgi:hypothetical protein